MKIKLRKFPLIPDSVAIFQHPIDVNFDKVSTVSVLLTRPVGIQREVKNLLNISFGKNCTFFTQNC